MRGYKQYFQEAFEAQGEGKGGYQQWWDRLHMRTDISEDDKWELECQEDNLHRLMNLHDNLRTQGIV